MYACTSENDDWIVMMGTGLVLHRQRHKTWPSVEDLGCTCGCEVNCDIAMKLIRSQLVSDWFCCVGRARLVNTLRYK